MLTRIVIVPTHTELASPVIFAANKNGTLRFCVDYRRFNALKLLESYPLLTMNECIGSLKVAQVSSTLDANTAYWQFEIDKYDKGYTASTSHHWLYQFIGIHFDLKNINATFQPVKVLLLSFV